MRIITQEKTVIDFFYDTEKLRCMTNSSKRKTRYIYCYDTSNNERVIYVIVSQLGDLIDKQ